MVKTKLRHSGKGRQSGTPSHRTNSKEGDQQHDDDDWVIVKKQRVTILIPAAPLSKRSITANHGPSHMPLVPPNVESNHSQLKMVTSSVLPSANEQEKTVSLAVQTQKEIQIPRRAPPSLPNSIVANPIRHRSILKSHKLLGVSKTSNSNAMKQPRMLLASRQYPTLRTTLTVGLRASNLERKLVRAGGLSRWLTSLGLGQFVTIFQGKSLSKYQLVNLTMKKLKDMGANAVGPRRKLIHAIDCVCQPYCFEAF